jgi:lysophospholipase L1-like esterase
MASKYEGFVNAGLNGAIYKIPVGVDYLASDGEVAALVAAGIPFGGYTMPAGSVFIRGTGSRLSLGINGEISYLPVGQIIYPTASQMTALAASGVQYWAGAPVPIAPTVPVATYLPAVSVQPAFVVGARRLVAAYTGPIHQIQRASDNATMDLVQLANGAPDYASGAAWAAGSQTRLRTWYEQQNGRHSVQATWANMPLLDVGGLRGQATAYGAFKSVMFDGWYDKNAGNVRRPKRMPIPATVTIEFQNHTVFIVVDPKSALYNDIYYSLARASGGTEATALGTATGVSGIYASGGAANTDGTRRARSQFQVLGAASGVSSYKFYQDGLITTAANSKWSDPLAGGLIGDGISGSTDFMANGDAFLAMVIYPSALSDTDGAAVRDALNAAFGIASPSGSMIVQVGDSIQYGPTVNESLEGRSITRLTRPLLKGNPVIYNMGLSSQLLTGAGQLAANASSREFSMVDYAYAKRGLFIEIGTNDVGGGVSASALHAALVNYVSAARTAGYNRIVTRTLLPRTQSGAQQTQMDAYNAMLRSNAVGADSFSDVADFCAKAGILPTDSRYFQGDDLHPTGALYELLAPIDAAAINAVM